MNKTAFLIVPCASFYQKQLEAIKQLCLLAGLTPIVAENESIHDQDSLLGKIKKQILDAEIVIIELLTDNFNIAFEAGITEKTEHLCGKRRFLVANYLNDYNIIPSDTREKEFIQYSTLTDLLMKLGNWLAQISPYVDEEKGSKLKNFHNTIQLPTIFEDFKDYNKFKKDWNFGADQIKFTKEGLNVTNAHFPVHTTMFSRFDRYCLKLKARIDNSRFGVALHVQKIFNQGATESLPFPDFCVMFNIDKQGSCIPHLLARPLLNKTTHYWIPNEYKNHKINLDPDDTGFFELTIKVHKHIINIQNVEFNLAQIDVKQFNPNDCMFNIQEDSFYEEFARDIQKLCHGNIGFRCHPINEEATINWLEVSFE
jgi:hypothetical protein